LLRLNECDFFKSFVDLQVVYVPICCTFLILFCICITQLDYSFVLFYAGTLKFSKNRNVHRCNH